MGFADLPTLADLSAHPRATPKHALVSRLDAKVTSDKDDAKLLEVWAKAVRFRDRERCRCCGIKTVRTLELDQKRGEAHHIVSRTCKVTRTDVRNGIWTCLRCHQKLTRHKLFIVGTAAQMFVAGRTGKRYLDGTCTDLRFVERNPT